MRTRIITFFMAVFSVLAIYAQTGVEYTPIEGGPTFFISLNHTTHEGIISLPGDYQGEVIIPSNFRDESNTEYTITSIRYQGFLNKGITSVSIPASVDTIGVEAFRGCTDLKSVTFNEGLKEIRQSAFYGCSQLGSGMDGGALKLPTTLTVLDTTAFHQCPKINSVNFSELKSLKAIGDMAFSLAGTPNIQPEDGLHGDLIFAEGLEVIGNEAFGYQDRLTGELRLSTTLREIGDMFVSDNGGKFTGPLELPDGLEKIGRAAFANWSGSSPDFKFPSKLKVIGARAFLNCMALAGDIVLPASVEKLGLNAFSGTYRITSISLPEGSQLKTIDKKLFSNAWLHFIDLRNAPIRNEDISDASVWKKNLNRTPDGIFSGLNPYTLVYLPTDMTDESLVADTLENFIQTRADGSLVCKNFKVYDDYKQGYLGKYKYLSYQLPPYNVSEDLYDTTLPYAERGCDYGKAIIADFHAQKAAYVRTFPKDKCSTVMLPFAAKVPAGIKAFKLRYKNTAGELYFLSIDDERMKDEVTDPTMLEPYTPYVILVTDESQTELENMGVAVTQSLSIDTIKEKNTTKDGFAFVGSIDNIYHDAAKELKAYTLSNNVWYQVKDNTAGFVHSFRGFVLPPAGSSGISSFAIIIESDTQTTAIGDIKAKIEKETTDIYTMDGRYMGRSIDSLPTGFYIVGGKKIYKF